MIAEIRNKASRESRQLEDVLTGNFFGTLRYLPIDIGLKPIMDAVTFVDIVSNENFKHFIKNIKIQPNYLMWEKVNGKDEIDLILDFGSTIVGIEIKFKSGLSNYSEKELTKNEDKIINQLARYAKILKESYNEKKCYLIFLAEQVKDEKLYNQSLEDVNKYYLDGFGYISWQKIFKILEYQNPNSFPFNLVIHDLKEYLKSKNLNGFSGFDTVEPEITLQNKKFQVFNTKNNQMLKVEKELVAAYKFIRAFHHELSELVKSKCFNEPIKIKGKNKNYQFLDLNEGKFLVSNSNHEFGWLCRSFMKVYKCNEFPKSLFTVEFKVSIGEELKPELILGRHHYSSSKNIATSNVNNETLSYRSERHIERGFSLEKIANNVFLSKKALKNRKTKHKYFEKGIFVFYPMLDINSSNLKEKIFDRFLEVNAAFDKYAK